jgi:predicted  nucleic acid-binding Zn-ribbon protein
MGKGTRIDDYTANILLDELKAKSLQLEKARKDLLETQRKLGYAETRSERLKELNTELAQVKARQKYLEEKLKKRDNIGKLPKEKLVARLEKESAKRLEIMTEMSEAKAALDYERAKNKELAENMSVLRESMVRHEDELIEKKTLLEERTSRLEKTAAKLTSMEGRLKETKSSLATTESELKEKRAELTGSKEALSQTKGRLKDIVVKLQGMEGEVKNTRQDLYYARGRLSATEKELAESRSRLAKTQRTIIVNELELKEAQKKIASLQNVLKNAVGDLSKTQSELNDYKEKAKLAEKRLAKTEMELVETSSEVKTKEAALKKTQESLKDAVERLQSDALEKYSEAAVLLKINMKEKRFLLDYEKGENLYLPEVSINGQNYLISSIDLLNTLGRLVTKSSRISQLSLKVGKPKDAQNMTLIDSPILSLNRDNRVCIIKTPKVNKTSLELLNYEELKKRGLQNLTLFKHKNFGQESCSLNGRISLGLEKGDNYLYIRNSVRKNDPELKAEVGDFIISKQGKFVGLAVEIQSFDLGRKERVKCFVFPEKIDFKNLTAISLKKRPGSEYYQGFAEAVAEINSRIKHSGRDKKK